MPERILLQVREARLRSWSSTPEPACAAREFPQPGADRVWARDPLPIDDDLIALVVEPRTVALFDLRKGGDVWTYREPAVLPRSGPPACWRCRTAARPARRQSSWSGSTRRPARRSGPGVLGIEDLSEHPDALAIDGDRVYCASGPPR